MKCKSWEKLFSFESVVILENIHKWFTFAEENLNNINLFEVEEWLVPLCASKHSNSDNYFKINIFSNCKNFINIIQSTFVKI